MAVDRRVFQRVSKRKEDLFFFACKLCAAARRRDPNRSSESPRTRRLRLRLAARRQDVLTKDPEIQTKNCWVCWKPWPLTREFWRGSRTKTGHLCFDPRCRLCQNAKRREACNLGFDIPGSAFAITAEPRLLQSMDQLQLNNECGSNWKFRGESDSFAIFLARILSDSKFLIEPAP